VIEWAAIFYIAKFLLWVVTGFEAICAYLIGIERLHRWALILTNKASSYRNWRCEQKSYQAKIAAYPSALSQHYDQLALKVDHRTATKLRELGERLAQEEERATEIDRLNSLSLELPGEQLPNPHYDNAQSLVEERRALALALNAPEPIYPRPPPLPTLAFAEWGLAILTWILGAHWLSASIAKTHQQIL
jgi:hypothetical protein